MQAIVMWASIALVALVALYALLDWRFPNAVARFEENVIAFLLGLITLVAFTQVIARYGFNSGWSGALEFQRILFAWLILFGMSYGVRTGSHLGVDALIRLAPRPVFRVLALVGAVACLVYASALLSAFWLNWLGAPAKGGAIAYWALNWRTGLGLDELRYPDLLQETFGLQERVQRWIAYLILPIGLGLFLYRSLQAIVEIATGRRELIIAGHEAEDLVEENRGALAGDAPSAVDAIAGSMRPGSTRPSALSDDGTGSAIVDAGERMKAAARSPLGPAAGAQPTFPVDTAKDAAPGRAPSARVPAPPPPSAPDPTQRWSSQPGKRRQRRLRGRDKGRGGDGRDRPDGRDGGSR